MSLFTKDYDYLLPEELIARRPPQRREEARMMVLDHKEQTIRHTVFSEFPTFLREGDLVVLNDTRVIPARVFSSDGKIELLFLEQTDATVWKCMVRPGKKMKIGNSVDLGICKGEVISICEEGERMIRFDAPVDLDAIGKLPIPPYMERESDLLDVERYQTVYAKTAGAVAAPTAGLHFTPEILAQINHAFVTLHVGVGTFKPVQVEKITDHKMHSERFHISPETATRINEAQRVIAIGTTTARVLESCFARHGKICACEGETDIFIYPPYQFKAIDVLLTNFHLPKSTLLMLISAFAGKDFVLRAYQEAIEKRYRFYSYGDCMLLL